ncbi:MAG: hypothetical protein IH956_05785 [Chloroflexi bacterium]|nr:hypothetical protein [Chloroflexota bacterium]
MKTELMPAFYALPRGGWRDYVTLLHLPYTVWHLSYVVIGASAAPTLHLDRVGGAVLAFFLAVGIGAHALDEFRGRPLGTSIRDDHLIAIAALSLCGAVAIGVLAILTISLWAAPFVLFGLFIVLAYNLELFRGWFHSDVWFGVAWGAFPALTGYWASAQRLDLQGLLVATGCLVLALAHRTLSRQARTLRRKARVATGSVVYKDGHTEAITIPYLLATPETALRLIGLSVTLLALGLLAGRL